MLKSEVNSFNGLGFRICKDGPKIYEKPIDKLAMYTSTQFENGSDVMVCLWSEEYVENGVPIMPENPTNNDK